MLVLTVNVLKHSEEFSLIFKNIDKCPDLQCKIYFIPVSGVLAIKGDKNVNKLSYVS
jgi:hypothetical protein